MLTHLISRCLYSDSKYNSTSSVLYPLKYNAWCVLNGGVNYKTKANHRLCKWCNLKSSCYICTTQNTFSHTISFYPYQSPMKRVLWSPFDTEGKPRPCFLELSHIGHQLSFDEKPCCLCWWVVDVGREAGREKIRGGEWGGGKTQRVGVGGWGWLRGQSPRNKVKANFQ